MIYVESCLILVVGKMSWLYNGNGLTRLDGIIEADQVGVV